MSLIKYSVEEFTALLAAGTPTPGGGSAAALAGGLAASLLQMVCGLTIGKEAYKAHETALKSLSDRAGGLRLELIELVDRDASAYDRVMQALRRPKATEIEKAARREALSRANLAATEVPLATAEACAALIEMAADLAGMANRNALSDVGTAAALAKAGLDGAILNVRTNLGGIGDQQWAEAAAGRVHRLEARGATHLPRALEAITAAGAR